MRLQRDSYAPKKCAFDAANVQFLRAHLCKSHPVLQHVFLVIAAAVEISSAFSAILVCALDLKPGKTGMVSGLFFGLSFGLGGIAAAAFGRCCTVFTQRSRA